MSLTSWPIPQPRFFSSKKTDARKPTQANALARLRSLIRTRSSVRELPWLTSLRVRGMGMPLPLLLNKEMKEKRGLHSSLVSQCFPYRDQQDRLYHLISLSLELYHRSRAIPMPLFTLVLTRFQLPPPGGPFGTHPGTKRETRTQEDKGNAKTQLRHNTGAMFNRRGTRKTERHYHSSF